jgi:hypothetical protein
MSQPRIKPKAPRRGSTVDLCQLTPHGDDNIAIHCRLAGSEVVAIVPPSGVVMQAEYLANPSPHGPASSVAMAVFGAVLMLRGESAAEAVRRLRGDPAGAGAAFQPAPIGTLKVWLDQV